MEPNNIDTENLPTKREIRKDVRSRLNKPEMMPGLEMSPTDYFYLHANNLWGFDKLQVGMFNRCRGALVNSIISKHPLYSEITRLRREENSSDDDVETTEKKTYIAKLIKKALSETLGQPEDSVEDMITTRATQDFERSYESQAFKIAEEELIKSLTTYLEQEPLYTGYLSKVEGLGAKTSAKLMACLRTLVNDPTKFDTPSSLWHYSGLQVEPDGHAEKKTKGKKLTSSPKLKSLVLGVIGSNILKQNGQYRVIYDERTRKTHSTHPEWWNLNPDGTKNVGKNMHPKHGYNDGIRVMMKRFECELWKAAYQAKGLIPPCNPYILNDPKHHLEPDIVPYGVVEN
jgi:hypothetical protein